MKKVILAFLCICLLSTLIIDIASAASSTSKVSTELTKKELKIAKAFMKSVETCDESYLEKYMYPGYDYDFGSSELGCDIRLLEPTYKKVYDTKEKLYKIVISGLRVTSDNSFISMSNDTYVFYLKTEKKKVYVYKISDWDHRYEFVEFSELSEEKQAVVREYLTDLYDEETSNDIIIDSEREVLTKKVDPKDDDTYPTVTTNVPNGKGTKKSPIAINQTYKYKLNNVQYCYYHISGTCFMTVNSVKKITKAKAEYLEVQTEYDKKGTEYVLVNITYRVKDGSFKLDKESSIGYMGYTDFIHEIDGTYNLKSKKTCGGSMCCYFDGSLMKEIEDKKLYYNDKKLSYTVTGNVVLKINKGSTNNLMVVKPLCDDLEVDEKIVYFYLGV